MLNRGNLATVLSEFFATGLLVMVALLIANTTVVSYFIATTLAVTLAAIVMVFGGISGAHTNPALTIGMWTARRVTTIRAIAYVAAQLLGALAAWQLYQYLVNRHLPANSVTFEWRIFTAEVVGTAILAMGFAAGMVKGVLAYQTALVLGAAIFVGVMVASIASRGYINPAIALGLRSWSSVYVLGPIVGGVVGVNLYHFLSGTWSWPMTGMMPAKKKK